MATTQQKAAPQKKSQELEVHSGSSSFALS